MLSDSERIFSRGSRGLVPGCQPSLNPVEILEKKIRSMVSPVHDFSHAP